MLSFFFLSSSFFSAILFSFSSFYFSFSFRLFFVIHLFAKIFRLLFPSFFFLFVSFHSYLSSILLLTVIVTFILGSITCCFCHQHWGNSIDIISIGNITHPKRKIRNGKGWEEELTEGIQKLIQVYIQINIAVCGIIFLSLMF